MEKKYKNKETGEIEELQLIQNNYNELLGNSNEFEKYRNNFNKFLKDFYK